MPLTPVRYRAFVLGGPGTMKTGRIAKFELLLTASILISCQSNSFSGSATKQGDSKPKSKDGSCLGIVNAAGLNQAPEVVRLEFFDPNPRGKVPPSVWGFSGIVVGENAILTVISPIFLDLHTTNKAAVRLIPEGDSSNRFTEQDLQKYPSGSAFFRLEEVVEPGPPEDRNLDTLRRLLTIIKFDGVKLTSLAKVAEVSRPAGTRVTLIGTGYHKGFDPDQPDSQGGVKRIGYNTILNPDQLTTTFKEKAYNKRNYYITGRDQDKPSAPMNDALPSYGDTGSALLVDGVLIGIATSFYDRVGDAAYFSNFTKGAAIGEYLNLTDPGVSKLIDKAKNEGAKVVKENDPPPAAEQDIDVSVKKCVAATKAENTTEK